MLIDTHLHLIDRTRLSYPWLENVAPLNRDWGYDDYAVVAKRLGITGVLHMEVDVAEADIADETAFVTDMMNQDGTLIRGAISSCRPEKVGFEAFLAGIDTHVVKGFRRILHEVPDDVSQTETFRANVRRIGAAGLPFDICMLQRQLPLAADLIDACPDTTFVLDHCGVPDIAGGDFSDWAASIARVAERPNVNGKISGITAYGPSDWTLDSLKPYVEHMIDCFGWDRVVWGSDSPVCTLNASLAEWIAATYALTAGASDGERAKLFSENATRIWRL